MELAGNDRIDSLILRTREGDEAAFEELVNMYKPMMIGVINHFGLNVNESFSEVCMGFYRAVSSYTVGQENVTFGLYAKICVKRTVIDMVRKNGQDVLGRVDDGIDVDMIAVSGGIQSMLEHRERMAHFLKTAKSALSDFEYDVYRYWMLGYKTADIAKAMGTASKSVDNAKSRMLKKLRDRLNPEE